VSICPYKGPQSYFKALFTKDPGRDVRGSLNSTGSGLNTGTSVCAAESVKLFVNGALHCIVTNLKRISKMSTFSRSEKFPMVRKYFDIYVGMLELKTTTHAFETFS